MSNVIQFPRPYMGPPGIGKSATIDYSDCDVGSPAWEVRLKRAIAKYGPPCADCNEVELVVDLDEWEAEHGLWDPSIRVVANPSYWPEGQLGVTYRDTLHGTGAGVLWAYKHGWYSGQWMFHGSQDEPDAFYGTSEGYVPKVVRDMAAPIIATYPPFHPTAYHEDHV